MTGIRLENALSHTFEGYYAGNSAYVSHDAVWYPKIKVKKLSDTAKMPTKNNFNDAGFDLYADQDVYLVAGQQKLISTSIALEIPLRCVGLIWPRSGLSAKQGIDVLGGVIDFGYTGEIKVCLLSQTDYKVSQGDKIAQILIQKIESYEMMEVDSLSESCRGEKGFGSSGK